jgi:hypothetical protein
VPNFCQILAWFPPKSIQNCVLQQHDEIRVQKRHDQEAGLKQVKQAALTSTEKYQQNSNTKISNAPVPTSIATGLREQQMLCENTWSTCCHHGSQFFLTES